jgi:2-hydroxymethylglutarate dehydrogenase
MGTDVDYIGNSGAGEVVKIINNLITTTSMCVLAEALVLGVKAGVDAGVLVKVLGKSSANSFVLQNHVKNFVLRGKFEKVYPVDYVIKDLHLVQMMGAQYHVPQYFSSLGLQTYEGARAAGYGDQYLPVVIKLLEQLTGIGVRADLE